MLPVFAPGCGHDPVISVTGSPVLHMSAFEHIIRKHHVLGSSTLLASGGRKSLILTKSDRPAHFAADDTFFRVASITKMATAALAMRLKDEGILDLERPVAFYFDDTSSSSPLQNITLRHLLSHTSGLIDPPSLEKDMQNGRPFTEFISQACLHPPGSSFHYSNLGFGLIGCVMEAVLNQPVGAVFRERLFSPLGMNATLEGCTIPAGKIMPVTRILPWRKGSDLVLTPLGRQLLKKADPLCHYGHTAGSMYSDIQSLYLLLQMLINDEQHFLSERSHAEMTTCHAEYGHLSPTLSYGLGLLFIQDKTLSDDRIIGHQGFAYGCADGAFWEESTGRILITLNGGCSEARNGRLGSANKELIHWAFRKELPEW